MKKTLFLIGLVTLLTSTATVSTARATKTQVLKIEAGRGAPHAVIGSFNQVVTDIMNTNFPNSGWDDSNIDWSKDQRVWVATGLVSLPGNNAYGIQIHSARFQQNGDFIDISYTVIIAN